MINTGEWNWEEMVIRVPVCFMWGLFNSLINDLEKEVNNHLIKFAFDTKLEIAPDTSEGSEINQKELEACKVKEKNEIWYEGKKQANLSVANNHVAISRGILKKAVLKER